MLRIGTRVKIKSLKWFDENKIRDRRGYYIPMYPYFYEGMTKFCGKELEVAGVDPDGEIYTLKYKNSRNSLGYEWAAEFFDIIVFTLNTE